MLPTAVPLGRSMAGEGRGAALLGGGQAAVEHRPIEIDAFERERAA